jgi:hypothetical protein
MKTPTIDNFLEAFLNPTGRFKTLAGISVARDEENRPRYTVRSKTIDVAVNDRGATRIACCPLRATENSYDLRRYVADRYPGGEEPTLKIGEVLVFNDLNESAWRDLWLTAPVGGTFFREKKESTPVSAPAEELPYRLVSTFDEGLAVAEQGGKYGYVDRAGNTVIPFRYDWAEAFDEGLAVVKLDERFGLIDKSGREILAPIYEDLRWRSDNGVILASGDYGEWRLYDRSGAAVSDQAFDFIFDFSCDLASVRREDKYGYIDRRGKLVIPLLYNEAYSFTDEGLATVSQNGISFTIDTDGMLFD